MVPGAYLMKLSEEMREVAKEAGMYGPVIEGWAQRVEMLELGFFGRLWHEIVCYWEDFLEIF